MFDKIMQRLASPLARLLALMPTAVFFWVAKVLGQDIGAHFNSTEMKAVVNRVMFKSKNSSTCSPCVHLIVGAQGSGKTYRSAEISKRSKLHHLDFNYWRLVFEKKENQAEGAVFATALLALLLDRSMSVMCDVNASEWKNRLFLFAVIFKYGGQRTVVHIYQNRVTWEEVVANIKSGTPAAWYEEAIAQRPQLKSQVQAVLEKERYNSHFASSLLQDIKYRAEGEKPWAKALWYCEALRCHDRFFERDGNMKDLGIPGLQMLGNDIWITSMSSSDVDAVSTGGRPQQ